MYCVLRCAVTGPVGRRFKPTSTLSGGYGEVRNAKPGAPPHKDKKGLLEHTRPRKPRAGAHQPPVLRSPFVHHGNLHTPTAKPVARLNNTLWGHHPNV